MSAKWCAICKDCRRFFNDEVVYNDHREQCAIDTEDRRVRWNKFCELFEALQIEYNVELDYGCGCCANGHQIDGVENPYNEGWSRC